MQLDSLTARVTFARIADIEKGIMISDTDFFMYAKAGFLGPGTGQNGLTYTALMI